MEGKKDRPDPSKSLVGFTVGKVNYAVPIGSVREIVNPTVLTELPHLPTAVAGVADHRGEVIPLIDLRARFGLRDVGDRTRSKWILVDVGGKIVGLIVDQVTEVFGTGGEEVRPAPALGGGDDVRGIGGVISHAGRLTFVLSLDRFEHIVASIPESVLDAAVQASEGRH
jgi:purine-binding chemotaxis protein CheW